MSYAIKEIFYTLQGEGANAGRPAVFCRFTGCNLWSGREQDRPRGAGSCARWCDTDFVGTDGPGGGRFSDADTLAEAVREVWSGPWQGRPLVVCTGGEPLLQMDEPLVNALHRAGFEIAIETNGTQVAPPGIDWICVSPKAGSELVLHSGDELKLIFPQRGASPEQFEHLDFQYFFIQPLDDPSGQSHTAAAIRYCLEHPRWRLSLQTHKLLGIP